MDGHMGSGKTLTSSYVMDTLAKGQSVVCCYYYSDNITTNLGNVYRSLIWQLLRQKPNLKLRFYQWQKMATSPVEPTRSVAKLRDFLFISVLSSPERISLCSTDLTNANPQTGRHCLAFLKSLLDKNAHLKVFLSSRDGDDDILPSFSGGISRIRIHTSKDKDKAIAGYLVKETSVPEEFHDEVVRELGARA
jgi:hypothetical protein